MNTDIAAHRGHKCRVIAGGESIYTRWGVYCVTCDLFLEKHSPHTIIVEVGELEYRELVPRDGLEDV